MNKVSKELTRSTLVVIALRVACNNYNNMSRATGKWSRDVWARKHLGKNFALMGACIDRIGQLCWSRIDGLIERSRRFPYVPTAGAPDMVHQCRPS